MREIKFRAWHQVRKVMLHDGDIFYEDHIPQDWMRLDIIDPCIVTNYGLLFWVLESKLPNATPENFDHRNLYSNNLKIMQYTGLQDKNGVEIYEGDIVKTFKGNFEVKWEGYQFVLPGFYCGSNDVPYDYFSEQAEDEVIGNVHEHAHLLDKA